MRAIIMVGFAVALTLPVGSAVARIPDEILCNGATALSGDSLACGGGVIRLYGIESPPPDTPEGEAARLSLERMVGLRGARCLVRRHVSRRLDVAVCYVAGRSVAERQVRAGHARRVNAQGTPSPASR